MKWFYLFFTLNVTLAYGEDTPSFLDKTKCNREKIEILFLNGVRNTTVDAERSKIRISSIIEGDSIKTRISPNGLDDICYKYIYNQTEGYKDFLETLAQKVREADPTKSEQEVYKWVSKFIFAKNFVLDEITEDLGWGKAISELEIARMQNVEEQTLKEHTSNIVIEDLKQRSVLLVSHSQGNLFADRIYDELRKDDVFSWKKKRFANLQIGSASGRLAAKEDSYGDHITLVEDQVINSLPQLGFSILEPNVQSHYVWVERGNRTRKIFDAYKYDQLGHGFIEAYTESRVKGKLDGGEVFRPMSEIFMDKLAVLAEKIWEPKCPGSGLNVDSKFNICAQILSVPKDPNGNVVFELSSCNNETELQEFESLFEDNLIVFYKSRDNNSLPIYLNLNNYKVQDEKLKFSVPISKFPRNTDYNIKFQMNLKIMQKEFSYGEGEVAECNDDISIPITFEGPNLYCTKKYYQHPEYKWVHTTEDSNITLSDQEISLRSSDRNDERTCYTLADAENKRCAVPANSYGLVCGSTVVNSYFSGNIYNSTLENSITGFGRVSISGSTVKNSILEYSTINSNISNGAFHFLAGFSKSTCKEAKKAFDDHVIVGKNFANWDARLSHTTGPACYSSYSIFVGRCESGAECVYHDPQYVDLEHFQEYLYK